MWGSLRGFVLETPLEQFDELESLLDRLADGVPTLEEHERLAVLLRSSAELRRRYVQFMILHARLETKHVSPPSGMALEDRGLRLEEMEDGVGGRLLAARGSSHDNPPPFVFSSSHASLLTDFSVGSLLFSYTIAAIVMGMGLWVAAAWHPSVVPLIVDRHGSDSRSPVVTPASKAEVVGRITGMVDCVRYEGSDPKNRESEIGNLRSPVHCGDHFAIRSGLLEITYDTGAKVLLQGPARYGVDSAAGGYLAVGKLTAMLEKKNELGTKDEEPVAARSSFAVRTPTAIVTDLGTEFGVEVDREGYTTSHVFRGTVELRMVSAAGEASKDAQAGAKILRANESARVEGKVDNRRIVAAKETVASRFVRDISKQTAKTFDLVDVVAGGDGFSGCRNRGIDPNNGRFISVLPSSLQSLAEGPTVTAPNVLLGATAMASSENSAEYSATKAIDGRPEVSDWVSARGAGKQILSVSGFNSVIGTIRIWSNTDIPIRSVAIRSSTTQKKSLRAADYETLLVPASTFDAGLTGWARSSDYLNRTGDCYIDFAVNAPPGTRSLFLDFGNSENEWVRVEEVQAFQQRRPEERNGGYHRVAGHPFIDGVFVPGISRQIDSTGRAFADFGSTSGLSSFYIWALGKSVECGPSVLLDGVDYSQPGHGLLYMPANKGITFDLDVVRRENSGWKISQFRSVGGNAEPVSADGSADLWVLVDGQLRFRRREINGYSGRVPIVFKISPGDRFLTLAATDGGNGVFWDWIVFGDPVLDLIPDAGNAGSR